MEKRNEIEKPWSQLTEREPAASGSLLAAYVAVDALEHRLQLQVEMLNGAATELTELHVLHDYTTSCEGRIAELQSELEDAERDWDELDSRHQGPRADAGAQWFSTIGIKKIRVYGCNGRCSPQHLPKLRRTCVVSSSRTNDCLLAALTLQTGWQPPKPIATRFRRPHCRWETR